MSIDWKYLFTGEASARSVREDKMLKAVEANTSAFGLMYWLFFGLAHLGIWTVVAIMRGVADLRHGSLVAKRARRIK